MTGKQHSAINFTSAVIVSGLTIPSGNLFFAQIGIGMLYSIIASPDVDVDSGNISIYFFRKAFGRIGAWYWQNLWKPYATNFAHRGISHSPVVGTLIRLIYIVLPSALFLLPFEADKAGIRNVLLSQLLAIPFTSLFVFSLFNISFLSIGFLVIGICLGDILHIICDRISSNNMYRRFMR